MLEGLRTARGVARSLRIYYGDRQRRANMDRLYARFVKPGDLVFDVGAHVGDRVAAFRRLGARVVAVEPQPALARTLRLFYGRNSAVTIEPVAVARTCGAVDLRLNVDNPTVSTASADFVRAAVGAHGWEGQAWTRNIRISAVTLDDLIARHGVPAFIKLDVEGFEAEALAGLSRPVAVLSFEFTMIQREVALASIARCSDLGYRRFDAALGESQALVHGRWVAAQEIAQWISQLPDDANSGDVYAALG
jgi:FkbM family methyltransferase